MSVAITHLPDEQNPPGAWFPGGFFLAVERWLNDVEQIQENDDGDGNPHKPQQNSTHNMLLGLNSLHWNHWPRVMVPSVPEYIFATLEHIFAPAVEG